MVLCCCVSNGHMIDGRGATYCHDVTTRCGLKHVSVDFIMRENACHVVPRYKRLDRHGSKALFVCDIFHSVCIEHHTAVQ